MTKDQKRFWIGISIAFVFFLAISSFFAAGKIPATVYLGVLAILSLLTIHFVPSTHSSRTTQPPEKESGAILKTIGPTGVLASMALLAVLYLVFQDSVKRVNEQLDTAREQNAALKVRLDQFNIQVADAESAMQSAHVRASELELGLQKAEDALKKTDEIRQVVEQMNITPTTDAVLAVLRAVQSDQAGVSQAMRTQNLEMAMRNALRGLWDITRYIGRTSGGTGVESHWNEEIEYTLREFNEHLSPQSSLPSTQPRLPPKTN